MIKLLDRPKYLSPAAITENRIIPYDSFGNAYIRRYHRFRFSTRYNDVASCRDTQTAHICIIFKFRHSTHTHTLLDARRTHRRFSWINVKKLKHRKYSGQLIFVFYLTAIIAKTYGQQRLLCPNKYATHLIPRKCSYAHKYR